MNPAEQMNPAEPMNLDQDTIVAISTPPGRGGIGIVRLSGPQSCGIVEPMLRLHKPLAHTRASFAKILDIATGEPLDEAIATFFAAPQSYTTEDVVEIACHGAPVLLDYLVRTCVARGARLAEPGEFTQRAFLSGRLDLIEAEAVNDLISASTLHQARVAAAQLGGSVARTLAPIKAKLIQLIATLEAGVDFAEDDLDLLPPPEIITQIEAIQHPLQSLSATYSYGHIVREGFTLAIVGRPNVGKSSLFNRLLERDRAIVTAQPGTTRDPISERLALAGIPVELVDTAGLREVPAGLEGEAEQQGILRSRATMAEADLVLHVFDAVSFPRTLGGSPALHPEDAQTLASLEGRSHLTILNKIDLLAVLPTPNTIGLDPAPLLVSAQTGFGMDTLKAAILAALLGTPPTTDSALLTNLRQHGAVTETLTALAQAHVAATNSLPHELLLLDLYAALTALDTLTGETAPDAIINLIFSTFCIGK